MFAFWSSYETIKGDSFEKKALMLSLTSHVFPWSKIFFHLKNFILLITDSVSVQVIYFSIVFFYRIKGCIQENFWQDLHLSFFKKHCFLSSSVHANESLSGSVTLTKMKQHNFFSVPLKIVGSWSCFSKSLIKMKKFTWINIFALLFVASKSLMEVVEALIKFIWDTSMKFKNQNLS